MGASTGSRKSKAITGINVTPFVDVMLVLLIIFMVTANYISSQSINVDLPKSTTSDTPDVAVNLGFSIDKDGQLFLSGEPILYTDVEGEIEKIRGKNPQKNLQAIIGADKNAKHGFVVKLIDQLRISKVNDFAISIEKVELGL